MPPLMEAADGSFRSRLQSAQETTAHLPCAGRTTPAYAATGTAARLRHDNWLITPSAIKCKLPINANIGT